MEPRSLATLLLLRLSGALRLIEAKSVATRRSRQELAELVSVVGEIVNRDGSLEARVVGETLQVNATTLRHALDNYVAFGHVLATLRRAGVGIVLCDAPPDAREWEAFLTSLLKVRPEEDPLVGLRCRLDDHRVGSIHVGAVTQAQIDHPDDEERRRAAKRTYDRSVAVAKEVFAGARVGRAANLRNLKHALHGIVDQVLDNEASLSGLSTLKDYDDYAFTHSVNVCIFCVALGKRLGLSKNQLYDLGMAALVHDLGMSRIPSEITAKGARLTPEEQRVMESHTWLGSLSIFGLGDFGEIPFRSMIAAYEHHMKVDGSGYPTPLRPREPSVFSRIIAVADAFDAATNTRSYDQARPADEVLRELWERPDLGFDPVVVKALINLLGIYPVGTFVILDTLELALVHKPNPDPTHIHRPIIRIICGADGIWLESPSLVDLADVEADGQYCRSIIKVTDPDRYSVKASEYFV